jgi:hypothetical protein
MFSSTPNKYFSKNFKDLVLPCPILIAFDLLSPFPYPALCWFPRSIE